MTRHLSSPPTFLGRAICAQCPVNETPLCHNMPEVSLENNFPNIEYFQWKNQDTLFQKGESKEHIYTIRRGWVKICHINEEGRLRIVRLMGPGSAIGMEMMLSGGSTYLHDAIALGPVEACRIPVITVNQFKERCPELFSGFVANFENHLKRADEIIVLFSTGLLHERIHCVLSFLSKETSNNKKRFDLPNGSDFAALTGTTCESVSRVLAQMKKDKILIKHKDGLYSFNAEERSL